MTDHLGQSAVPDRSAWPWDAGAKRKLATDKGD